MPDKKREVENEKKTLQKMPRVSRVCVRVYVCERETEVKQQNIIKNWGAIYWKTT